MNIKMPGILRSLLFPPCCAFCGTPSITVTGPCVNCYERIKIIAPPVCERCGAPKELCTCRDRRMAYQRCVGTAFFEGDVAEAVKQFKRNGYEDSADIFAGLMAAVIRREYSDVNFDLVTCVPVTKKNLRRKGFNHAELLAKKVAKLLDLSFESCLEKPVETKPQKSLGEEERLGNVLGAFSGGGNCRGRRILLIDDVRTSGATLSECAKTLLLEGAFEVYAAVFALSDG